MARRRLRTLRTLRTKRTQTLRTKRTQTLRNKRTPTTRQTLRNKRTHPKKGGNYDTDFTTRTYEGQATEPLHTITSASTLGTMSGAAYARHKAAEYLQLHSKI